MIEDFSLQEKIIEILARVDIPNVAENAENKNFGYTFEELKNHLLNAGYNVLDDTLNDNLSLLKSEVGRPKIIEEMLIVKIDEDDEEEKKVKYYNLIK